MKKICSIPGCERAWNCRDWCRTHYSRWRRHGDPRIAKIRLAPRSLDDAERLWFHADKTPGLGPNGDCWLYTGHVGRRDGYGFFWLNGKTVKAHRYAFFVTHGHWPLPDALHSCDVRHCINPDHIRQGTPLENTADMIERGRQVPSPGSKNGTAKLTESQIPAIRQQIASGKRFEDIGQGFGVCGDTIRAIHKGKLWRHVPKEAAI